jgi:hypothetical protein
MFFFGFGLWIQSQQSASLDTGEPEERAANDAVLNKAL